MDTDTLTRICNTDICIKQYFSGRIYSRNTCPLKLERNKFYVFHDQISSVQDGHFLLISTKCETNEVLYLDTFGKPPKYSRIIKSLNSIAETIVYNDQKLQNDQTQMCFAHVIFLQYLMARNWTFNEIMKKFYQNEPIKNDLLVWNFISNIFKVKNIPFFSTSDNGPEKI